MNPRTKSKARALKVNKKALPKMQMAEAPKFYSVDGGAVETYDIEIQCDPSAGKHNKTKTRYAYNANLEKDVLENFDFVSYVSDQGAAYAAKASQLLSKINAKKQEDTKDTTTETDEKPLPSETSAPSAEDASQEATLIPPPELRKVTSESTVRSVRFSPEPTIKNVSPKSVRSGFQSNLGKITEATDDQTHGSLTRFMEDEPTVGTTVKDGNSTIMYYSDEAPTKPTCGLADLWGMIFGEKAEEDIATLASTVESGDEHSTHASSHRPRQVAL